MMFEFGSFGRWVASYVSWSVWFGSLMTLSCSDVRFSGPRYVRLTLICAVTLVTMWSFAVVVVHSIVMLFGSVVSMFASCW